MRQNKEVFSILVIPKIVQVLPRFYGKTRENDDYYENRRNWEYVFILSHKVSSLRQSVLAQNDSWSKMRT